MEVIATAQVVLGLIDKIRDARKTMKDNVGQKSTLADRILVLEPEVRRIVEGKLLVSTPGQEQALKTLVEQITKAHKLIGKFGERTVIRKMDRFFKHHKWAEDFASINAMLTRSCADLQFSLVINAEERRKQDLQDQTLAFEELIAQATEDMHADSEATEENLRRFQQEVAEQHRAVVDAIISINKYSPLAPADQQALADFSRQQFASLDSKLDAVVRLLQEGRGTEEQQRLRRQQLAELTLHEADVELENVIGAGSFGVVCRGLYQHNAIVAVKIIKLPSGRPLNSRDKEAIEN